MDFLSSALSVTKSDILWIPWLPNSDGGFAGMGIGLGCGVYCGVWRHWRDEMARVLFQIFPNRAISFCHIPFAEKAPLFLMPSSYCEAFVGSGDTGGAVL
eukprot:322162-Amorphochlora_amoeboformis.AAC.1